MSDAFYLACREFSVGIVRIGARLYCDGMEHVPRTGPALLLSNHISHFDPPCMMAKFPRITHFMADKPLLEIPILGKMLHGCHVFPIDRTKNDRSALRTAIARVEAGHIVGIFPERGIRHGATATINGAELPIGTASLWRMLNVPVIPMIIIGGDQLYARKNWRWPRKVRVCVRVGAPLPPDKNASREELRDRIATSWRDIFASMQRDYQFRPEELPQSAHQRWGVPEPKPKSETESPAEK